MSVETVLALDLDAGWRRTNHDLRERVFVRNAFELDLLTEGKTEWLTELHGSLQSGAYTPAPSRQCEVPKPGFHIRPGAVLEVKDIVVYSGLMDAMYPDIRSSFSQKPLHDYGCHLLDPKAVLWYEISAGPWSGFIKKSLEMASHKDTQYVLIVDIAGY